MTSTLGKVKLAASVTLLLSAFVGAFVTPGAGRLTSLAREGRGGISPCGATAPSAPAATSAEAAKENLKAALAASQGSSLAADVVAAAEVGPNASGDSSAAGCMCVCWFVRRQRFEFGEAQCGQADVSTYILLYGEGK